MLEARLALPAVARHERGAPHQHVGVVVVRFEIEVGPRVVEVRRPRVELIVERLRQVRLVAHPLEELLQFVLGNAGQEAGVGDLVSVQMEDRKHAAVTDRIDELVAVPARGERPGLGLAVADDAGNDQIGIVEGGPVSVT